MAKLLKISVAATGGTLDQSWPMDHHVPDSSIQVNINILAGTTGSFSMFYTLDDPWGDYTTDFNTDAHWVALPAALTAAIADAAATITHPLSALRITAATGDRTADVLVLQSGIRS